MNIKQANQSLYTLDIPALKGIHFSLISIDYLESLSSSDFLKVSLSLKDGVPPKDLINQAVNLTWDSQQGEQYYHGLVTGIMIEPDGPHHHILELSCESFLFGLKQNRQTRHFVNKNLKLIINDILTTAKINFETIIFHLSEDDPIRDYTEQHDESDFSFMERILHEVGWCYLLSFTQTGTEFHCYDKPTGFPSLESPIPFEPLSQGTKTRESIFEFVHKVEQQERFEAKSDCMGLRAGNTLTFSEHPNALYHQQYLITAVRHEYQEKSLKLRYFNTLSLLPISETFVPVYSVDDERILTMGIAKIHSDTDAPLLTEKGEYILKSTHTGELTHPVRLTTPYAGLNHGLHFPLHDNTQVLVAYLNGHPDEPVVLGALFNEEQRNTVNATNPRQNLLISESGNTLLLDDTPGHQKINLHTSDHHHRLSLDATKDAEKIEMISETGSFHANIHQSTEIKTEHHCQIDAGESIEIIAGKDCLISSAESHVQCEAAQDIQQSAGQDYHIQVDQDMLVEVKGNSQTNVKGNMRTDIESGDYILKLAAGNSHHQAQRNLQFTTSSGDIVLKTAGASVTFKSDGDIVFSANKIILDAKNIDIHNAGSSRGNS